MIFIEGALSRLSRSCMAVLSGGAVTRSNGLLLPEGSSEGRSPAGIPGLGTRHCRSGLGIALAHRINGTRYVFPENDRGIEEVSLEFDRGLTALIVRTTGGEMRTPVGMGSWRKSRGGFTDGLDQFLSVPIRPRVAASGGWMIMPPIPYSFETQDLYIEHSTPAPPSAAAMRRDRLPLPPDVSPHRRRQTGPGLRTRWRC